MDPNTTKRGPLLVGSFFLYLLGRSIMNIMPGSAYLEIWREKNLLDVTVFLLNVKCPKLLCGVGICHRGRQTIPMWNSLGVVGVFRAPLYVWYPW